MDEQLRQWIEQMIPCGQYVGTLPFFGHARLAVSAEKGRIPWSASELYPASTTLGKTARFVARAGAFAGIGVRRRSTDPLALDALGVPLKDIADTVVYVGPPGPVQKVVARALGVGGSPLCYVKSGRSAGARERVRRESRLLATLPEGIGPALLGAGETDDLSWLCTEAVEGEWLPRNALPPPGLVEVADRMIQAGDRCEIAVHPYILKIRASAEPGVHDALEVLSGTSWPCAWSHGDMAPWNCLVGSDGRVRLIDWEYGDQCGLPYLDLAYYALQVSYFVKRADPSAAIRVAISVVNERCGSEEVARALARIACYAASVQEIADGHAPNDRLRLWRREIWSGVA